MSLRGLAWLVAFVALAPTALAETSEFTLRSERAVELDARVSVEFPAPVAHAAIERLSATWTFTSLSGSLRVASSRYVWRPEIPLRGELYTEPATSEVFLLENATLLVEHRAEYAVLTAVGREGSRARIAGESEGAGLPTFLSSPFLREAQVASPDPLPSPPGAMRYGFEAGWPIVGIDPLSERPVFPPLDEVTLSLTGPMEFQITSGNATFVDAEGRAHAVRLGNWTEEGSATGALTQTRIKQTLVFDGSVAGSQLRFAPGWTVGGASSSWEIDGSIVWAGATGEARAQGETVPFENARVTASSASFAVEPQGVAGSAREYEGTATLRVNNVAVGAPTALRSTVAATGLALLLLALAEGARQILPRALAALYTRIARDRLLDHPARRLLVDLVRSEPGVHLRELQRRAAMRWGAFTFHLQMLEAAGLLFRRKEAGLVRVGLPAAPVGAEPRFTSDVALTLFRAMPPDGSPITAGELVAASGAGRQLVNYHLNMMEARGLVDIEGSGARRMVARRRGAS